MTVRQPVLRFYTIYSPFRDQLRRVVYFPAGGGGCGWGIGDAAHHYHGSHVIYIASETPLSIILLSDIPTQL